MPAPSKPRTATLRRIGNPVGLTLPKDVLESAGLAEKSTVHLVQTPDGLLLKRFDENVSGGMEAYRVISKKYQNALRELSK